MTRVFLTALIAVGVFMLFVAYLALHWTLGVIVHSRKEIVVPLITGKTVIEALVAALSATPLFRAVQFDKELFINGSNVANEPTRALLSYLRHRVGTDPGPVHIYSVSPFPMSRSPRRPP